MSRSNSIDQIAQDLLTLHREQSVSRSFSSQYSASGAYNTSVVGSVSASNAFGSSLAQNNGNVMASYSNGSNSGIVNGSGSVGSASATYAVFFDQISGAACVVAVSNYPKWRPK